MSLSTSQITHPHRKVSVTGLSRCYSVIERSFHEAHRADEREVWWTNGEAEKTLNNPKRSESLVRAFLERFLRREWQGDNRATSWSEDEINTWEALWNGMKQTPSHSLLATAWVVMALHRPEALPVIEAAGADIYAPHYSRSIDYNQRKKSAWTGVLECLCRIDPRNTRNNQRVKTICATLERTWPPVSHDTQSILNASNALIHIAPTYALKEGTFGLQWRKRFRDRLLAEGALVQWSSETPGFPPPDHAPLPRWIEKIKPRQAFSASTIEQEWGETLIHHSIQEQNPVSAKHWCYLMALVDPSRAMYELARKRKGPWETSIENDYPVNTMAWAMTEVMDGHKLHRYERSWHTNDLQHPHQIQMTRWLKGWKAIPFSGEGDEAFRKEAFTAWITHTVGNFFRYHEDPSKLQPQYIKAWKDLLHAWFDLNPRKMDSTIVKTLSDCLKKTNPQWLAVILEVAHEHKRLGSLLGFDPGHHPTSKISIEESTDAQKFFGTLLANESLKPWVDIAMKLPGGDRLRRMLWKTLIEYDKNNREATQQAQKNWVAWSEPLRKEAWIAFMHKAMDKDALDKHERNNKGAFSVMLALLDRMPVDVTPEWTEGNHLLANLVLAMAHCSYRAGLNSFDLAIPERHAVLRKFLGKGFTFEKASPHPVEALILRGPDNERGMQIMDLLIAENASFDIEGLNEENRNEQLQTYWTSRQLERTLHHDISESNTKEKTIRHRM